MGAQAMGWRDKLAAERAASAPVRCANCGERIVRCWIKHQPWELCDGWRHASDDPALTHAVLCRTSSTADDQAFDLAEPEVV